MKKILILTAGYGEGHNTAARNIRAAIESVAPCQAEVKIVDLMETTYGRVNDLLKKAYLAAINHVPIVWEKIYGMIDSTSAFSDNLSRLGPLRQGMETLLAGERPDAVVSTYPIYNYLIDEIYGCSPLGGGGNEAPPLPRPFSQITVITDSISINSIWFRCGSDAFLVANEETASVLRGCGVPGEKLHVLGFPVAVEFAERCGLRPVPSPGERWQVLYAINSGKKEAPQVVRELLKIEEADLRVTVGRDAELRAAVETAVAESGRSAEIFGWTDRMPELMKSAHLLISKAGGATVQESLAACTPLVMTQVVPGQEEGNARLLLENDCGVLAATPAEIAAAVATALADDGALWRMWRANIERLSRPDAARCVARFILDFKSSPSRNRLVKSL